MRLPKFENDKIAGRLFLMNEIKLEARATIVETLVDLRFVIGNWIFVLDKIDGRWSAIRKELVKEV